MDGSVATLLASSTHSFSSESKHHLADHRASTMYCHLMPKKSPLLVTVCNLTHFFAFLLHLFCGETNHLLRRKRVRLSDRYRGYGYLLQKNESEGPVNHSLTNHSSWAKRYRGNSSSSLGNPTSSRKKKSVLRCLICPCGQARQVSIDQLGRVRFTLRHSIYVRDCSQNNELMFISAVSLLKAKLLGPYISSNS